MRRACAVIATFAALCLPAAARADCQDEIDAIVKEAHQVAASPKRDALEAKIEMARRDLLEGEEWECRAAVVQARAVLDGTDGKDGK